MAKFAMPRRILHGLPIALISVGLFLMSVIGSSAEVAPVHGDAVWKYLASLKKQERLDALRHEAAREGTAVMYGALGIDRAQIFIDLFHKTYPDVTIQFVRLTSNELGQRVIAEQRSGRVNSDLILSSPDWLDLIKEALAPYEPTTWDDFDPRFRHGSRADGWTALDYEILPEAIAWRSDRISRDEAPKSFDQLAQPKWKGRTGTVTQREDLVDALIQLYGEKPAMEKVHALGALENHIYPSIAALSAALAAGEVDIAWGIGAYRASGLKRSGVPVDYVIQDPACAIDVTISVSQGATHPYAAALVMEFLTDAKVLEQLDKIEPGRLFANTKGSYSDSIANYPKLFVYRPIPQARYRELNRIVEREFLRH